MDCVSLDKHEWLEDIRGERVRQFDMYRGEYYTMVEEGLNSKLEYTQEGI